MHIFLAGAGGTVGHTLVPLLLEHGHTVTGTSAVGGEGRRAPGAGARAVVMDGLDREAVLAAVRAAEPDAIVHQMTALAGARLRSLDRVFVTTNRLRTEGTEHLLAAAAAVGVERVVAQSFAGWPSARAGGPVKTEADPLDPDPPRGARATHAAIRRLEALVVGAGGVVLRYGGFYGPGSGLAPGGEQLELVRRRAVPARGRRRRRVVVRAHRGRRGGHAGRARAGARGRALQRRATTTPRRCTSGSRSWPARRARRRRAGSRPASPACWPVPRRWR